MRCFILFPDSLCSCQGSAEQSLQDKLQGAQHHINQTKCIFRWNDKKLGSIHMNKNQITSNNFFLRVPYQELDQWR